VPKIQWTNLPPALRDHLFDRLRDRKITVEIYINSNCGESRSLTQYPKTFLLRGHVAKGEKL